MLPFAATVIVSAQETAEIVQDVNGYQNDGKVENACRHIHMDLS